MEKIFYIFRHGETDYNVNGIWQGQKCDIDLNENGINQALSLTDKFKDKKVAAIYSSPLKRASNTAEILSKNINVPKFVVDALKEANLGAVEGLHKTKIKEEYAPFVKDWYSAEAMDKSFPDGETKKEVALRFVNALKEIAQKDSRKEIAISTHSAMMRCLFLHLGHDIPSIKNAEVYTLTYDNGKLSLKA